MADQEKAIMHEMLAPQSVLQGGSVVVRAKKGLGRPH
jgi:hypothetical protein